MLKFLSNSNRKVEPNGRLDSTMPCGYCRTAKSLRLYPTRSTSGDGFYLNRCLNCHAVFLSPRPTQQQLDAAYDDSYYGQGQEKFTGSVEKMLDIFRAERIHIVSRYVTPPAKILDIGCGNGRFVASLIKRRFQGYGTELPGKAAQRAAQIPNLNLKIGQLDRGDFTDNFFDSVCMWHVFEHLTEPEKTLQIIKKILKPGGYLMMSMPNIDSIQSKIFRGNWLHLDPPRHLFFLGPSDLISIMKNLDFELVEEKYFSLEQNPFGMQQSLLNCFLNKRELLFEVLKGNEAYSKEYSRCSIMLQKLFCVGTFGLFALLSALEAVLKKGGTMSLIFKKAKTQSLF